MAKPSLGQFGFTLVAIAAVLATLSAINATLYGAARLSYVIATEGELPDFLEDKIWNQPLVGLLVTIGFALLLSNLVNLSSISTMGSAGFLVIFAIVDAANFKKAREVKSSKLIAGLGVLSCVFALRTLVWHTFQTSPSQLWILVVMVGIASAMEGVFLHIFGYGGSHKKIDEFSSRIQRDKGITYSYYSCNFLCRVIFLP